MDIWVMFFFLTSERKPRINNQGPGVFKKSVGNAPGAFAPFTRQRRYGGKLLDSFSRGLKGWA